MSIVNHIDKYNLDADVKEFYMTAAMYILHGIMAEEKSDVIYTTYPVGNTRHRDWGKFTQNRIIGPSAVPFSHIKTEDINPYICDLGDTNNHMFSDFIVLNNQAKMCILDISNYNEVIVDMLASSMHTMKAELISQSYGYLSFTQQLLTLMNEKKYVDRTHSEQYTGATLDPEQI